MYLCYLLFEKQKLIFQKTRISQLIRSQFKQTCLTNSGLKNEFEYIKKCLDFEKCVGCIAFNQ